MDRVLANLKLFAMGLVVVAILFVLVGLCGKFLGAYGMFVGFGLAAGVVAYLINRYEEKINAASETTEGSG